MRAKSSSAVWVTGFISLIGVGVCLFGGSGAVAEEPECGVMESDPATWPDPSQFPPLPEYCFGPGGPGPNECTDNGCIIDVLVVYSPAARIAAAQTPTPIELRIADAVAAMNVAFVNSEIQSYVRLVGTAEVDYDDVPGGSVQQALTCLSTPSCMPLAHVLRDELKADMVSLFVEHRAGWTVGYASILDSFNAVTWRSAAAPGGWIFAHEMGHNLGAMHQTGRAPKPYCHGYVRTTTPAFSTIVTNGGPIRIQDYSNPDVSYLGVPTGYATTANNAHCIQVYAPMMVGGPPTGRGRLSDCNLNRICDAHDIAVGTSQDCNTNGVPDSCDIAGGTSDDCNADGIPDECQPHGACCLDPGPPQVCVNTTQCACDDLYGNFAGVGTKCETINCLIIPMLVQPGDPDP